jgi:aminoglycoside phosphotransferase (APT) family kinase protein
MLELTTANALDYLRQQGWVGPGPAEIELLGGGVSNIVLRVRTPERVFVLKQSCPQLRTRDAWFSDLDRVYREQEVMEVLHPLLPPGVVPEVLFCDRPNYVFAMSHAPLAARVWKAELLAGHVDPALGERAGSILGRMHEATANDPRCAERFADRTVFVQLRVDPFYRRVQERRPEVAAQVEPIIERLLKARDALCHGDFTPKNLLTHGGDFTLVDYETAHFGDPTMDVGLFLAHLLLKAVKHYPQHEPFFELTRAFWRGYAAAVRFKPLAELEARGIEHLAVCLLARIDGTSPVDYLPEEEKREVVRNLARGILRGPPARWSKVLDVIADSARVV